MQRVLEPEVMDTPEEADGYEAMDHSVSNAAFVQRLVELGARGRMLDIGTGPGHVPVLVCAAIQGARVVGVDLSRNMLAHAERRRIASPWAARIELLLADAKRLDFGDGTFDAVLSNTILHHIPEPGAFLREAKRVLRPGGALLVRDLYRPSHPERVAELVREHAADATADQRELLRASLCAALTPDELRAAADEAGLEAAEIVIDTDRHVSLQMPAV